MFSLIESVSEIFPKYFTQNMWTYNISNLNPLVYYHWGVVKTDTKQQSQNSRDLVKSLNMDIISNLNKNHLIQVCSYFSGCIKAGFIL